MQKGLHSGTPCVRLWLVLEVMKTIQILLLAAVLGASLNADAFRNLDFEEANTNRIWQLTPGRSVGLTTELLPGWKFLMDDSPISLVGLDAPRIADGSLIGTLFTRESTLGTLFPPDGSYAFALGSYPGNTYRLTQRGDIPWNAKYLYYKAHNTGPPVSIDGNALHLLAGLFPLDDIPRFLWFDISAYAGRNVELQFVVPDNPLGGSGSGFLDSIGFASSIPEPGTMALLLLGCVWFGIIRFPLRASADVSARARPR
jgi:hypothetical protein